MKKYLLVFLGCLIIPGTVAAIAYLYLFEPHQIHEVPAGPLDLVISDIDNDQINDVLVASRDGMAISIFVGDGIGGLRFIESIEVGAGVTSLAVGDLNGDGDVDIVASLCNPGCTDNSIGVFLGNGSGNFTEDEIIPVQSVPYNVMVHDFNDDGRLDIVASDYPNGRFILIASEGEYPLFQEDYLAASLKTISLVVSDVNGDGNQDILGSNHGSGSVTIHFFSDGASYRSLELKVGDLPYAITTGRFNHDDLLDLAVAHSTSPGEISVFLNKGEGNFQESARFRTVDRLIAIASADMNGDLLDDLLVTQNEQQLAMIFLNQQEGVFVSEFYPVEAQNAIYSMAIGHLNEDDIADLATVDFKANTLSLSLGKQVGN